jgi:NADH-quinone oxidoreductase subunit C
MTEENQGNEPKKKLSPALAARMEAMKKKKQEEGSSEEPKGEEEAPKKAKPSKLSPALAARLAAKKATKSESGSSEKSEKEPAKPEPPAEPQPHDLAYNVIKEEFGDIISDLDNNPHMPFFEVTDKSYWQAIAYFMRTDERLKFNYLSCLSGMDYNDGQLGIVCNLESLGDLNHKLAVKVKCSKDDPHIPSVAEVWLTADWHEREAYDLLGIVFDEHPDMRRILCPDDWEGYPLRKDYQVQEYYHGIRVPY